MANDMEELNLELPEGLVEETETDTEPITSVFEVEEETVEPLPEVAQATTSLGALLSGIKLD